MLDKLKCFFGFHAWSMTRGFYGTPHHTAVCLRCEKKYNQGDRVV